MVTGDSDAAFTGVYKMAARMDSSGGPIPVMKFSDNPEKTTNPGIKQVWRLTDSRGAAVADILGLDQEDGDSAPVKGGRYVFWHPSADYRHFYHTLEGGAQPLLKKRLENGALCAPLPPLAEIKAHMARNIETFDSTYKRLLNPHGYKVSITEKLRRLKLELINIWGDF
jgi:nicotinate phosphoribosyltransferase